MSQQETVASLDVANAGSAGRGYQRSPLLCRQIYGVQKLLVALTANLDEHRNNVRIVSRKPVTCLPLLFDF
jgi:hypothetical protein